MKQIRSRSGACTALFLRKGITVDKQQQQQPGKVNGQEAKGLSIHKSFKRVLLTLIICVSLALIVGAVGFAYIQWALQPTPPSAELVQVDIPPGIDSSGIAERLEQQGLIRSSLVFSYYLKLIGEGNKFQAGIYEMSPGITIEQLISRLNNGQTVKEEVVRFTVPEGFTVSQIADKLSEQQIVNRDIFLDLLQNKSNFPVTTLASIPDNTAIKQPLEGYLFPETYEMKKGSSEREIVERMLTETERKLDTLPQDWREKLKERGWTLHQLMTAASLVEREVVVDDERPLVAGIIFNRLSRNMALQMDAAVQYALDKQKDRLFHVDLQIESPYNTYLYPGLPPGPISSPGLASIKAVLYPESSNYLFYVTKKDGSKRHLFAVTYEEHQKNIAESNKNIKITGTPGS